MDSRGGFGIFAIALLLACSACIVSSCAGGGTGSGGGGDSGSEVLSITIDGLSAPLWTNGHAVTPFCPAGAPLNARFTFRFTAPINPSSLPADGPANGTIAITVMDPNNISSASGTWDVDHSDPCCAYFYPFPPADPAQGCVSGLQPLLTYSINIPNGVGGAPTLQIGDGGITQAINVCFTPSPCPSTNPPAFIDAVPGPPFVISTNPNADPMAPQTTQTAIAGPSPGTSQIIVDVSEPLEPTSVNVNTVQLFNVSSNAFVDIQMAGQTTFQQTGTIPGAVGQTSRVIITTSQTLPDGDIFDIRINGVADLGGNLLAIAAGQELKFSLADNMDDVEALITDDFTTTLNLGSLSGAIEWEGTGMVQATFPQEIVGDGTDGAMVFTTNMNINTSPTGGGFGDEGLFNFTTMMVNSNVVLSFSSTTNDPNNLESVNAAQIRAQQTIVFGSNCSIQCNGNAGAAGQPNGGLVPELGGAGGPGGGRGGQGSPNPSDDSPAGEMGFGGNVDPINANCPGNIPNSSPSNLLFGGGGGGTSGPPGPNGPAGGGGGTASSMFPGTSGESQAGNNGMGGGAPLPGAAGPAPAAMIPPLVCVTTGKGAPMGGSGGGGGGDRLDTVGNPGLADTGGAGGGGGGALRVSAGSDIILSQLSAFQSTGGNGGAAGGFLVAQGGGGSGGSILLQTFTDLDVQIGITFQTGGGLGGGNVNNAASNGEGGTGGAGVIQLEDSDGVIPNQNFLFTTGELFTQVFAFSGVVVGTAESRIFDTESASTDYVRSNGLGASMVTIDPGSSGLITLEVIGLSEDPLNPGNPSTDPAGMMGPVDINDIDQLNGFRYFKFVINTEFPPPPATSLGDPLPQASFFQIAYVK